MLLIFLTIFASASSYHLYDRSRTQRYIDLSYKFDNETIYFPGMKRFQLHKEGERVQGPGYSYAAYTMSMAEHGGTHLDAPFHFNDKGWTVDQIPQDSLIDVPTTLIDVSSAVKQSRRPSDFTLDVHHVIQHEIESNQVIPFGGVLLIYTGWSKYWPDKIKYLGWDNSTDVKGTLNFPGISANLANWLVNKRHITGIGLDTASIDPGNSKSFPAHAILSKNQIYNLENVANLDSLLRAKRNDCALHLFVMPLKVTGGTGAPASILAYCKENEASILTL
ncbi:Kynurenine formamidase [Pseudolycoriella hygida]|uniref:Kynurenine formamidase n=1 Tax=Pseudolycoriella hygida TaxID=35572 RepID=A0A9Q0S7I0_9DIPT|nr:Kynurenine formamidase [Pseudolycoriella hygida]